MTKRPPPWQFPAIVSGIIIALGALGTFIVNSARYIELPKAVEAAQQKNVEQDKALDKLTGIQETWQKIYQQQQQQQAPNQAAPASRPTVPEWWWEQDGDGNWYCQGTDRWWWPDDEGSCE